ncbi:MAG: LysM peptidoglycan-binding domain-containing protein [Gammaproteobacteria bacterium]|nr:LysM peptidoglycan-binding domain-containing protein [Gammaproteobacteria bacterium]
MNKKWLGLGVAVFLMAGCASTEEQPPAEVEQAKPAEEPAAPAANANDSYTVVSGDHLWGISGQGRIYGNPYQWPLIYKANADQIEDADLIKPGQVLTIDRNASAADIDAAVNHAKTRGAWTLGQTEASDKAYLGR